MKNIKISFVLLLLISFTACKKDKQVVTDDFDPSQYYLTGEYKAGLGFGTTSYVYAFLPNGKVVHSYLGGFTTGTYSYTYANGIIKVGDNITFNVVDGKVVNSSLPDSYGSYYLEKIPDVDAFAGKTFRGTVSTDGVNTGKSCLIKFNTGKFTVSIDGFAQAGTGEVYTLHNNGFATADAGIEGRLHLMTIADGKLIYSQNNKRNTTKYFGILTVQ